MSGRAVIDSLEFARTGQQLAGAIPWARMSRLVDLLEDPAGECRYEVAGGSDSQGRPYLEVRIRGRLVLRCQRCLGPLDFPVEIEERLLLGSEREAVVEDHETDEPDWIVARRDLVVDALIEDEVLLELPMVPRHAEGQCSAAPAEIPESPTASPFAALDALKRR